MLVSRNPRAGNRFITARISIFLIAAAVWLTGLYLDQPRLTGVATILVLIAVVLGLIARRGIVTEPENESAPEE